MRISMTSFVRPVRRLDRLVPPGRSESQIRSDLMGMSRTAKDELRKLDLTYVKPSQLGRLVVQLRNEGKLSEDMASKMLALRSSRTSAKPDDRPFNAIQALEAIHERVRSQSGSAGMSRQGVAYQSAVFAAKGLDTLSTALRGGARLNVAA